MNKLLRELYAKLREAEDNVRAAIAEGNDELAEAAMADVRKISSRIDTVKELERHDDGFDAGVQVAGEEEAPAAKDEKKLAEEYRKVFLKAVRRRRLSPSEASLIREYKAVMHEGGVTSDPDGDASLIVPQDIQTNINAIMRELNDLTQYVRQEQTRTLSGRRVLEADEDMVPMAQVDEYGEIQEMDNPKFVPVEYTLRKRAGFLPLTSELLADTDQNILAYVENWIARKVVVTRNVLIRNVLATLDKVPVSGINDLKRILNVDLDPAISTSAIILTNQDGFHFLDTQEDNDGRPLLQPDPTNATQRLFKGRPIVVLSNRHFPTVDNKAPMVVGNLRQLVVHFWRGMFELASTREGGEAWRRDSTELRVITRDDVVLWDEGAAVYGEITLSP